MKLKNKSLLLLSALWLVGCSSLPQKPEHTQNLVRTLKVISVDNTLLKKVETALKKEENIHLIKEDGHAELTLLLKKLTYKNKNTLITKPKLIGRLEQRKKINHLTLEYTLLTSQGEVIQKGETIGIGRERLGYFPALNTQTTPIEEGTDDAIKELNIALRKALKAYKFKAQVTMVLQEKNQVAIPVYKHMNLSEKSVFYKEALPEETLQFSGSIGVYSHPAPHALLTLKKGTLPKLGDVLVHP